MPIADDLREIGDRASRELDAIHDYFVHSQTVWEAFRTAVTNGHVSTTTNPVTGTVVDQHGLGALAPEYTSKYLVTFTFRQFVSEFESFFFAFLHRVLRHNPWQFKKCQVDFETVLRAADRDEVIDGVLSKQLNDVKYENVRGWFEALDFAVKLGCPTADEIDALAEVKATRDIVEHNDGVVNAVYLRKAGKLARHAVGDVIELDDDYHLASWRLVRKIAADITTAATDRLSKP